MTQRSKIAVLQSAVSLALFIPVIDLALRWYLDRLGPLPVGQAILVTGDWVVVLLLVSLALTPMRGLFEWPMFIHIRRHIGIATALYALLHFSLYVCDQEWNLGVVIDEIAERFYLSIGFAALTILLLLAAISTAAWQRRLKRNWKRLNLLVFPAAALALWHFFLQSKIDVGQATFAAGLFVWMIAWRSLPGELRSSYAGLILLAVFATIAAAGIELAWYSLLKHVDPTRIVAANVDLSLAPRPVQQVMMVAIAMILARGVRRLVFGAGHS